MTLSDAPVAEDIIFVSTKEGTDKKNLKVRVH